MYSARNGGRPDCFPAAMDVAIVHEAPIGLLSRGPLLASNSLRNQRLQPIRAAYHARTISKSLAELRITGSAAMIGGADPYDFTVRYPRSTVRQARYEMGGQMATRTYRLKVARDGYEFEAEGDKRFVLDMLRQFAPRDASAGPPAESANTAKQTGRKALIPSIARGKSLSIREFIQQLSLKMHTDLVVAFGYYLEKFGGIPEFTPADLNNCYYEAKLESSNTSVMIIRNIKRGYLMPSKKKGEKGKNRYTLTASGEKFIEAKLSRN